VQLDSGASPDSPDSGPEQNVRHQTVCGQLTIIVHLQIEVCERWFMPIRQISRWLAWMDWAKWGCLIEDIGNMAARSKRKIEEKNGEVIL